MNVLLLIPLDHIYPFPILHKHNGFLCSRIYPGGIPRLLLVQVIKFDQTRIIYAPKPIYSSLTIIKSESIVLVQ